MRKSRNTLMMVVVVCEIKCLHAGKSASPPSQARGFQGNEGR